MANAAMDQIEEWHIDRISESLGSVTSTIAAQLSEFGWQTVPDGQRSPHLIGIRHPRGLPNGLVESLYTAGVSVSVRGDSVRIGPYLHSTEEDVDRLVTALSG